MAGNTRPDWAEESDGDLAETDPAIMADIQRAMEARGYKTPNGQQDKGDLSPPPSNTATDPDLQSQGADAGNPLPGANAPVVDAPPTPGTGGAVAPGGEAPETAGQELPPPHAGTAPGSDPPPSPSAFDVVLPSGDHFVMNNDQANYLIQLHNWIDGKSQEVKDAWALIEKGTHQPILKEDHTAYQAWVSAGRPTATQPALQRPQIDTQFVNQEFLDYVDTLEKKVTSLPVPQPSVSPDISPADMQARATVMANRQVQVQQALDQSTAAVREKYNLTTEQVAHLSRVTPALGIIPSIADRYRTYSPLGDLISDAPMGTVFSEAFEVAMSTDPTLRPVYEDHIVQRHAAINSDITKSVASKKANAASLATAPSAAVPGTNLDPSKMTSQQRHDAMVAELAQAMAEM